MRKPSKIGLFSSLVFLTILLSFQNCTDARLVIPEKEQPSVIPDPPPTPPPVDPPVDPPPPPVDPPPAGPPDGQLGNGGTEPDDSDPIDRPPTYQCEFQQPDTPALVQPEYIDLFNGTNHRLWSSSGLRPSDSPGAIPRERDSSEYNSIQQPCEHWYGSPSRSLNRFVDMSKQGNYLYLATSSGFSIWDIAGDKAKNPQRTIIRDGLCDRGSWLSFPPQGENDFFTKSIATYDKGNNETLIVISGLQIFAVWTHNRSTNQLIQNYQLIGGGNFDKPIRIVNKDNEKYAIYKLNELRAFNLNLLSQLNACLETYDSRTRSFSGGCNPSTPELVPYTFSDYGPGRAYILEDVVEINNKIVLITRGGVGYQEIEFSFLNHNNSWTQFERRLLLTMSSPGAVPIAGAFVKDNRLLLITNESLPTFARFKMGILDLTNCVLNGISCNSNMEIFSYTFAQGRSFSVANYSKAANGKDYLYIGKSTVFGIPTARLLDITGVLESDPIVLDMTTGTSFVDPCTGYQLNYFEAMSKPATYGTNQRQSYFGKWFGDYFYRGATGVFEVHEINNSTTQ